MAKIEYGSGILLSIDTEKKTLHFEEVRYVGYEGQPPPKKWELPYALGLDWEDPSYYYLVGGVIEYVLSDGTIVSVK